MDKLGLAALEATLRLYADAAPEPPAVPVLQMLGQGLAELEARAGMLIERLSKAGLEDVRLDDGVGFSGGGSLPGSGIATKLVTVRLPGMTVEELAIRLRRREPALIGRIADGRLVLDMRTVSDGEVPEIAAAFIEVLS
jgi:L-seryl-tRNA(Ser) seleniumtransferase